MRSGPSRRRRHARAALAAVLHTRARGGGQGIRWSRVDHDQRHIVQGVALGGHGGSGSDVHGSRFTVRAGALQAFVASDLGQTAWPEPKAWTFPASPHPPETKRSPTRGRAGRAIALGYEAVEAGRRAYAPWQPRVQASAVQSSSWSYTTLILVTLRAQRAPSDRWRRRRSCCSGCASARWLSSWRRAQRRGTVVLRDGPASSKRAMRQAMGATRAEEGLSPRITVLMGEATVPTGRPPLRPAS